MKEVHKINNLEHVKLLSDPLKLKLISAFSMGAKTTKEVAEELGESVTKLYRHVDALQDAGLLTVVEEVQKRGTIERRFTTIARRFEVEQSLFSDTDQGAGQEAIREILRGGEEEIVRALSGSEEESSRSLVMRLRVKGTRDDLDKLKDRLQNWIDEAQELEELELSGAALEEAGVMIAFYPVVED